MDRNEVVLVGRLPEAVHIRSLQSGSTLGTWRLIVRRQHRGRGGRVDTIPCMSFEPEVTWPRPTGCRTTWSKWWVRCVAAGGGVRGPRRPATRSR
ncbi:hypothetical protein ACFQX6_20940 [Streptosporangium lutulentum]